MIGTMMAIAIGLAAAQGGSMAAKKLKAKPAADTAPSLLGAPTTTPAMHSTNVTTALKAATTQRKKAVGDGRHATMSGGMSGSPKAPGTLLGGALVPGVQRSLLGF